jgi:hypothetical protein
MPWRKALALLGGAALLGVLAVAVARDRPPTVIPYPGRFVLVSAHEDYLLDRWTGRLYVVLPEGYIHVPRIGEE